MVKIAICAVIITLMATGGAAACSPAEMTVTSRPHKGDVCALSYVIDPYTTVGLGKAQNLGEGFVLQPTFEGNACSGMVSLILSDCKTGEVAILGEGLQSLMDPESSRPLERLDAKLRAKGLSLQKATAAALGLGFTKTKAASTRDRIKMRGKTFDLSCGCKMFY